MWEWEECRKPSHYLRKLKALLDFIGFICLQDKTNFYFISATGEPLLKVNAGGKCIQTTFNHTQRGQASQSDCFFWKKLGFLKAGLKGPRMGHAQLWFRTLSPQSLCSSPASPSFLCSVEKLLVQVFSLLLVSELLEVTQA